LYLIAKTSEVTDQFVNPSLNGLRIGAIATFLIFHTIVQNLPHHSASGWMQAGFKRPFSLLFVAARRRPLA